MARPAPPGPARNLKQMSKRQIAVIWIVGLIISGVLVYVGVLEPMSHETTPWAAL